MPADKPTWGGRRVGPDGKTLAGRPRKVKAESVPAEPKAPAPKNLDLTRLATMLPEILAASEQHARTSRRTPEKNPFQIPWFPKAAIPKQFAMAMDSMPVFAEAAQSWLAGGILNNAASEALLFPGYTYLSQLCQQPDFRNMSETIADDATRKWIKFEVTGDEQEKEKRQAQDFADPDGAQERRETRLKEKGKTDKVKALNDYMTKLGLQKIFFDLCRDDGFFGRTHLYLNFGDDVGMNSPELKTPIGDGRDALSRSKVNKGRPLRTVKTIEPLWAYPTTYNAQNPLAADWYDPTVWYVMGTEIHASRLLRFIGRPVPDILKPAYAFGGVSLSQLISPSVDIWIRTRNSTAELIHSFSVMVLSTDLSTMLQPGTASGLLARATLFNALRDNQNLMIVNKTTEDFKNVSASLAGLDDLQAQAQEHVASTGRVPLVKYTGLQPKGLNASAEGEIAVYDDTIMAYQNRFIRPNLSTVINFMQLSLWDEVDPEITFEFEPLRVMTEKEKSEKQKSDAERDGMRLDQGAISAEEIRGIIIADPDLPYTDLNPDDMPEPPDDGMGEEGNPEGAIGKGGKPAAEGGGSGKEPGGEDHVVVPFFEGATDEWNEGDHPRGQPGNAGQFGPGGGGGKSAPKQKIVAPQFGMPHGSFTASSVPGFSAPSRRGAFGSEIDTTGMKKVGAQMGSNPGGVFEDESGKKFYVKKGQTKDHVRNELTAVALAELAGMPTLHYRPVKGGDHIATEMEKLDKNNASKLTKAERSEASRDFVIHAWIGNYDAIGTGGDNIGTIKGVPVPLDFGGSLDYRAQGKPKGDMFGAKAKEIDTMRDPNISPDAAAFYGSMTPSELRESARYVTRIPDEKIRKVVEQFGGKASLADKLIARKNDIAERARYFGQEGDPTSKDGTVVIPEGSKLPVKELNGVKFGAWRPPADWGAVDGQDLYDEPEFDPGKKKPSSGVVIREPDGRVWLMQPRGGYGGYEATFPKGGLEKGLSLQANAIKEAYEETGLKVRITGFAGDHEGDVTVTRFYHAVREGGDPSKHEDESEGVVLAPKKKAEQFLNRKRDREVLAHDALFNDPDEDTAYWLRSIGEERRERALAERERQLPPVILSEGSEEEAEGAEDEFTETDHPRSPDGKFTDGAGGSSSGGGKSEKGSGPLSEEKPFWGLWQTPPGGSKEGPAAIVHNVEHFGNAPSKAGKPYRTVLAFLIKQAQALGGEKLIIDALKVKLIEGIIKSRDKAAAENKPENVAKLVTALGKFKKDSPQLFEKALSNLGQAPGPVAPAPKPAPPPPPVPTKLPSEVGASANFGTPTEAELTKAKKNVKLQMQFVPNAPQTPAMQAKVQNIIDAFNKKYEGKTLTNPDDLKVKVNDFKAIAAAAAVFSKAEAGELAAHQQKQAAEFQKQQIEAKAKASAKAKELAENAKKHAEAATKKNAAVMAELGISSQEAEGFNALVSMLGHSQQDVVEAFKGHAKQAESLGYPISGFQAALIKNYSDGGFGEVNSQLRSGSWTPAQHVYVKMVNKALAAMPAHTGTVTRNTSLSTEQLKKYLNVGHVIQEDAFMSTSTGSVFSGNVQFKINAIGKRGASIKKLSNHASENEVLFQARTFFKVEKVDKTGSGKTVIHLTEWED